MMFPLIFMFVLLNPQLFLVNGVDLTYDDLIKENAHCYPKDSCKEKRSEDSPDIPIGYSCSCDRDCSQFGSCCIDSVYRDNSLPMQECRSVGYYMVSRCGSDTPSDSIWKGLCEAEWNEEDDLTKLAPVSSLDTFTTYKNYYCFRCHETTEKFQYWNLELVGFLQGSDRISEDSDFNMVYNKENKTWIATAVKEAISIDVKLQFMIPDGLSILPLGCIFAIISDCPDSWTDQNMRDKCNAYTAVVYKKASYVNIRYKNPHCAFCNFESLNDFSCKPTVFATPGGKEVFSFIHLLNINRPSFDKIKKQCEKNQLWDPYGRKCRNIRCVKREYIIKDCRCTPP